MGTSRDEQLDALDRGNGNGSGSVEDDFLDQTSPFHNEWGSTAATTFNPAETSNGQRSKFEDLYKLHNGKMEQTRRQDIRTSHITNDAETFMSVLEMPKTQRRRVLMILEQLDISSHNFGSRQYENIILAICSLVSDEALTRRYDANGAPDIVEKRMINDDRFQELMQSTGMSASEHRQIRAQVREKSDYF